MKKPCGCKIISKRQLKRLPQLIVIKKSRNVKHAGFGFIFTVHSLIHQAVHTDLSKKSNLFPKLPLKKILTVYLYIVRRLRSGLLSQRRIDVAPVSPEKYYIIYLTVTIFCISANSGKNAHFHVVIILLCQHTGHRWLRLLL